MFRSLTSIVSAFSGGVAKGQQTMQITLPSPSSPTRHTVTPSVVGGNGRIEPDQPVDVDHNAYTTFTVTPDTGYQIDSVTGSCGGTLVGNTYTTVAITSACTVVARFKTTTTEPTRHTVTPSVVGNGRIEPDQPVVVDHGDNTTFNVTPDTGYQIDSVTGSCGGTLVGNTYTTGEITSDCTVIARFSRQYPPPRTGSLQVIIEPARVRDAGAQWRRVGTLTWYNSGDTESNVPTGVHTIEFKDVSGWRKPDNLSVGITAGQTATAIGNYIPGR